MNDHENVSERHDEDPHHCVIKRYNLYDKRNEGIICCEQCGRQLDFISNDISPDYINLGDLTDDDMYPFWCGDEINYDMWMCIPCRLFYLVCCRGIKDPLLFKDAIEQYETEHNLSFFESKRSEQKKICQKLIKELTQIRVEHYLQQNPPPMFAYCIGWDEQERCTLKSIDRRENALEDDCYKAIVHGQKIIKKETINHFYSPTAYIHDECGTNLEWLCPKCWVTEWFSDV